MKMNQQWFKDGLRFRCTGCGRCCTGSSGYVFLSASDIEKLAAQCQISQEAFLEKYTRIVDGQICLLDAPQSDKCIFLKNKKCEVYLSRPVQCRTFPWWLHHLQNPEHWKSAAAHCEGINHPDAPTHSETEIACECMKYVDNLVEQNSSFE